jgi:hypothetical protein
MPRKFVQVLAILLLINFSVNGQFKKGMRMAGATVATAFFNSGTTDVTYPPPTQGYTARTSSFGLNISPQFGWFISENTVIGVSLLINPSSNKASFEFNGTTYQEDKATTFNAGLGGFARNYFGSSSGFKPFGQFSFNVGISNQKTDGFFYGSTPGVYKQIYDGKSTGGFFANTTLTLGLTKMLNPNTGLDIYAGYTYSYNKNTVKTTFQTDTGNDGSIDFTEIREPTSKFSNHGFMIGVGFQVFLEPRK